MKSVANMNLTVKQEEHSGLKDYKKNGKAVLFSFILVFLFTGCNPQSAVTRIENRPVVTVTAGEIEATASIPTLEATATEREPYFIMDFGITPARWDKIYEGKRPFNQILESMDRPNYFLYQYQVWGTGGKISYSANLPYKFSPSYKEGKGMAEEIKIESYYDEIKNNDLERKVFDAVMESEFYMEDKYLDKNTLDVWGTIVYTREEENKIGYYMVGNSGIAIYVRDGEVQVFPGNQIPNSLPDNVKEKFKEKFTRVESSNGIVEGYCLFDF